MGTMIKSRSSRVLLIGLAVLLAAGLLFALVRPGQAYPVPIISIVSVDKNVSVTIAGTSFPPSQTFTVTMGAYGTYGKGGVVVGSYDSGSGASFTNTYAIPASLTGLDRIAIRFESAQGFYSYNWFYNDASASPTALPGYSGYPTFDISSVVNGSSVTILTHNMPAGQVFTVRMGAYGTYAQGGTIVGSTTDSGGSYSATFAIPADLASLSQIAIRMDGPTGLYAFNWFYNSGSGSIPVITLVPGPVPGPTPVPGYVGIPTISISAVVRDSSVTIYGNNFPAGQTFNVLMGTYGSYGMGGVPVTSVSTGSGGSFSATYSIPGSLAGLDKIAIRLETTNGYYYAYNWFYNNTTY